MSTKTHAEREVFKGARYLLFKNPSNLNKEKKEDEILERLLAQSSPLPRCTF
jgi:hypothetical protein